MKPIPTSTIEKVRRRMNKLTGHSGVELARKLMEEQTSIAAYLTGVEDDLLNEDERAHLFYMGIVIWQVMKEGGALPEATFEDIQRAEVANIEAIERTAIEPGSDARDEIYAMLAGYGQPDLLRSVLMTLVEPVERGQDDLAIRPENTGVMLLDLKTVIDVLNA